MVRSISTVRRTKISRTEVQVKRILGPIVRLRGYVSRPVLSLMCNVSLKNHVEVKSVTKTKTTKWWLRTGLVSINRQHCSESKRLRVETEFLGPNLYWVVEKGLYIGQGPRRLIRCSSSSNLGSSRSINDILKREPQVLSYWTRDVRCTLPIKIDEPIRYRGSIDQFVTRPTRTLPLKLHPNYKVYYLKLISSNRDIISTRSKVVNFWNSLS